MNSLKDNSVKIDANTDTTALKLNNNKNKYFIFLKSLSKVLLNC